MDCQYDKIVRPCRTSFVHSTHNISNQHDSMTSTAIIPTSTVDFLNRCVMPIVQRRRRPHCHDDIENNMDTWAKTLVDHDHDHDHK